MLGEATAGAECCRGEVSIYRARADADAKTDAHVAVLEFEVDRSAVESLAQIEEWGYVPAYPSDAHEVLQVGVNYDGAGLAIVF